MSATKWRPFCLGLDVLTPSDCRRTPWRATRSYVSREVDLGRSPMGPRRPVNIDLGILPKFCFIHSLPQPRKRDHHLGATWWHQGDGLMPISHRAITWTRDDRDLLDIKTISIWSVLHDFQWHLNTPGTMHNWVVLYEHIEKTCRVRIPVFRDLSLNWTAHMSDIFLTFEAFVLLL